MQPRKGLKEIEKARGRIGKAANVLRERNAKIEIFPFVLGEEILENMSKKEVRAAAGRSE